MRIQIICPASPMTVYGNRVTAVRWSKMLRPLGHSVDISQHYGGTISDLMVAMHAARSADAILQFRKRHPEKPSVLVLTGTDIYRDVARSAKAREAMQIADRLVIFQPLAKQVVPDELKRKVRLIYQSAEQTADAPALDRNSFVVSVVGHVHEVKDPLRAAMASRKLPKDSKIRIVQAGDADDGNLIQRARTEALKNPRYRYLGSIPRWKVRNLIAGSHLLVLSSRIEGGANALSEAIVDYVPVLASRIPGNVGILGEDYPGYFEPGDTDALTELMYRAETDEDFYQELKTRCALLARQFRPEAERRAWEKLIKEVSRIKH
ncbi:MAG TPA: TIGR04348 family glycosyltransferase [Bryobacterales bacterium]|nr:TIGR04348 family glycosyltransferase [Bryobacterales bacterium]